MNGMEMLGTLPYDPLLAGLFVSELGEALNGEWLVKPKEDVIIEEFLIGAMSPPSALKYFRSVRKAALITGGDRVDLQNLALETGNIKCDVKIRRIKELVERFIDLKSLEVLNRK